MKNRPRASCAIPRPGFDVDLPGAVMYPLPRRSLLKMRVCPGERLPGSGERNPAPVPRALPGTAMRGRWLGVLQDRFDGITRGQYRLACFVLCALFLLVSYRVPNEDNSQRHGYVHQALAFTKGSLSVDADLADRVEKDGKYFVVWPPFPAVLLMPFVYAAGTGVKTLLITPFLGALTALLAFRLALKAGAGRDIARWATLGVVFGTSFLLVLTSATDSYFANCCAMLFGFAALSEAFGAQRGWLIGFALGFSVLSRQATVFLVPMVWAILVLRPSEGRSAAGGLRAVAATAVGLGVCLGFNLWFNWARFGDPLDTGYARMLEGGWARYRFDHWGNFSLIYVPSNLIRMFLVGFDVQFAPPSYMVPGMGRWGTSLTFASPFVFYALRGRIGSRPWLNRIGWISIGITCLTILMYKGALGGWQINGLRYTLDFMPALFVFLVLGMERSRGTCHQGIAKFLIGYSIVLNLVAFYGIPLAKAILTRLPH